MKKLLLTTAILLSAAALRAQGPTIKSYVELTHIGNKYGTAIGYSFKNHIEVGGFHQEAPAFMNNLESMPRFYEKTFTGAYFNFPVKRYEKGGMDLNIRTGAINSEYFCITPTAQGYFNPVKLIKLGAGVGIKAFRPTFQASISLNLTGS
ncbi:MAG: hypothetical protein ABJ004_06440 [Cyclobacteriaceae bacterium]